LTAVGNLLVWLCLCSLAQATTSDPDVESMIASMVRAYAENHSRLRPYVITRDYVVSKLGEQKTNIIAAVIYLPPEAKTFEIRSSTGGGAERVVRKLLQKEMQVGLDFQDVGFKVSNYEFEFLGEELLAGARCYVLALRPKRKSKDLITGKIWLDKSLYLVRRVQGTPVKSPSWWVKDVTFTVDYGNLEGMWLQVGSTGEAKVRFAGNYKLVSQMIAFALLKPLAPTTH
jgi:outer membrane lipoprotein-sorting protein